MSIKAGQRTVRCSFCDSPLVVSRPAAPGRPQPIFALGFVIELEDAAQAVRRWINRRRMAPFGLKSGAAERITGVYLPTYLYSARAHSEYQASIAENYRRIGMRENSEGHASLGYRDDTEYYDLIGRHVAYVADILVTASSSVDNHEVEAIEPFDLRGLRHYSSALIAGWNSEEFSLAPEECVRLARAEAQELVGRKLHDFMPGDGVRSLHHSTEFLEESIDPTLVPVWVFAVRYHPRKAPVRILVNGQTGKVGGAIPFSWVKLGVITAAAVTLVAALAAFGRLARYFL
jgi:hypothetical protein